MLISRTKNCPDCKTPFETDQPLRYRCLPCANRRQAWTAKAHAKVFRAVRAGQLTPQPCDVCGVAKAHAHHADYSRPLDVRWLCRPHHRQLHEAHDKIARFAAACPVNLGAAP